MGCVAKSLFLEGKLVLKNVIFHYESLFFGNFTWGEVHLIDQRQVGYGSSWYW